MEARQPQFSDLNSSNRTAGGSLTEQQQLQQQQASGTRGSISSAAGVSNFGSALANRYPNDTERPGFHRAQSHSLVFSASVFLFFLFICCGFYVCTMCV